MRCLAVVLLVVILTACSGEGGEDGLRPIPPGVVSTTTSLAAPPENTVALTTTTATTTTTTVPPTTVPPTTTTDPWARPDERGDIAYWQRVLQAVDDILIDGWLIALDEGTVTEDVVRRLDATSQGFDRQRQAQEIEAGLQMPPETFQPEPGHRTIDVVAVLREARDCVVLEAIYDNSEIVREPNPPELGWIALRSVRKGEINPTGWQYSEQTEFESQVDLEAWCSVAP